MKAALLYGIEDLRVVDIEKPKAGPNGVLIKVKACAVCPTDIRKYRTGDHGVTGFPMNLGHEWTGDIVEVGENVKGLRVGMRVVGGDYAGYAEYAAISKEALQFLPPLEIPENTSYEEATFTEPLADCIHAVRDQAQAKAGDSLAIIGAGQMGLQMLMVAKAMGVRVLTSEAYEPRLNLAKKLGADHAINAAKEDPVEAVKKMTGGKGADAAIASIGHPAAIVQGLKMVKPRGRVVIFGGAPEGTVVPLDPNVIHYNEIILTGSSWVGVPPYFNIKLYNEALELIASKKVPVGELITHRFPLDQIRRAFEIIDKKEGLKAIIIPP